MRKVSYAIVIIMSLFVFVGCGNKKTDSPAAQEGSNRTENNAEVNYEKANHEVAQAMVQTDNCSDYKMMKREADVVVKGKKASEKFVDSLSGNETKYLLAQIEITEVYKDGTNLALKQGRTINVHENEEFEPANNTIFHIDDYRKMEKGKEYYLFLKYTPEYDRYYILGVHRGKVPVDTSEKIFYKDNNAAGEEQDHEEVHKIIKEVQKKYD